MCTNNEPGCGSLSVLSSPKKSEMRLIWMLFYWTNVITTPATADILQTFFKHVAGVLSNCNCLTSFRTLALSSLYKVCLSSSRYLKRSQCIFVFESAYSLHEKGFRVPDNAFWTHKCLVVCSVFTITWGGTSFEACKPPLNAGKVVVGLEGVCLDATCTSFGYTSRTHSAWVPDPECSIASVKVQVVYAECKGIRQNRWPWKCHEKKTPSGCAQTRERESDPES